MEPSNPQTHNDNSICMSSSGDQEVICILIKQMDKQMLKEDFYSSIQQVGLDGSLYSIKWQQQQNNEKKKNFIGARILRSAVFVHHPSVKVQIPRK